MSRRPFAALVTTLTLALAAGAGLTADAAGDLFDPDQVRDYAFTFDAPDWEAALRAAGDTGNAPARLVVDGEAFEQVGVRNKGLSSLFISTRKRPLNLKVDAFVRGQRLRGYDVVNLNNGYSDPSFVREALMTEALRPFMPSQQTAFARVSVNGEYLGLYLAVEQVEGTFVATWFPRSSGILVKCDPPAGPGMGATTFHSALRWEGESLARYRPLYEVKTRDAEEAGLTLIREAARVLDAPVSAGGTRDADLLTAVPKVLEVDRALWYLAANNLFVNYDSYYFGHNYFLYYAEEDGLLHFLLWDTSLSFGGLDLGPWGGGDSGARVDPFALEGSADRPVLRRLLSVPEWRADYAAHYRALLDGAFDTDMLSERGAALQALARPGLIRDPNRLFGLDLFDRNLHEDVTARANMGPGGRSPGVLKLARERSAWLRAHPALAPPDHQLVDHARVPEAPQPEQAATVTLRFGGRDRPQAVRLVYRVNGGRPAAVELAPDDEAWRGELPGLAPGSRVSYYARVSLPGARADFHPRANLSQPWSYRVRGPDLPIEADPALVINELMADNKSTVADEAGEYDDWLEVYNRGSEPISLAGHYLGPSASDPWRYALPAVVLAPGEHFLVWCDNDLDQGLNHAPFKLNKAGESVRLSSREATLDLVTFGPQETDLSWARVPDGLDWWTTCHAPSPGSANLCPDAPRPTATEPPTAAPSPTSAGPPTPTLTPSSLPVPPPQRGGLLYLPVAQRP